MNLLPQGLVKWVETHSGKAATLAAWTGQGIGLVSALASVPLIMQAYDDATAGVWYFLLGWVTFFQLCDFGFSQSISRQISYSHSTGSTNAAKPERRSGFLFFSVRGPRTIAQFYACTRQLFHGISLAILVLGILAERTVLFSGKMDGSPDTRVCWYLIVGMAIALNEARTPATLLAGSFQVAWVRIIGAICALAQNVVFLGALFFRPPLWVGGLIFLAGGMLQWWLIQRVAAARCPQLCDPKPRKRVMRAIWMMSWRQGVASTAAWFIFSVNPLVVGYWLGEAAVAALAVPTRMAMLIFAVLSELASAQLNFMVRLVGEQDVAGLLRKFFLVVILTSLPGLAIYGGFASLGIPFIRWWTLGRINLDFATIGWLALYCWLALLQIQAACFVAAHGRSPFALPATAGAILNIALACLLLPRMGLPGATFSTFLAQLLTSNWVVMKLAIQQLADYSRRSPGVVRSSFRDALAEVASLRVLKSLFAR